MLPNALNDYLDERRREREQQAKAEVVEADVQFPIMWPKMIPVDWSSVETITVYDPRAPRSALLVP